MYVYNLYQSRGGGVIALKIYEEKYRITKVSRSRDRSTYGRLLSIHTHTQMPFARQSCGKNQAAHLVLSRENILFTYKLHNIIYTLIYK